MTVAVDVVLTPELASEGLARDVIRRIQNLRKVAGFELDDRILTTYQADSELGAAIDEWRELIRGETLSVELRVGEPGAGAEVGDEPIGEHALRLGVRRV